MLYFEDMFKDVKGRIVFVRKCYKKCVEFEMQEFLLSVADVVVSKIREFNKSKLKAKSVRAKRVGGKYQGQIEYDDGSKKNVSAERINGELVSTIQ